MRESIGGTWLFGIVALFIVLFSGFLAYSISYTKAFKVKNEILNLIERNEGFTTTNRDISNMSLDELNNLDTTDAKAFAFLKSIGYNSADVDDCESNDWGIPMEGGYCIKRICAGVSSDRTDRIYYKVTTFIKVEIPVVDIQVKIPISGETKVLYYESSFVDDIRLGCYSEGS